LLPTALFFFDRGNQVIAFARLAGELTQCQVLLRGKNIFWWGIGSSLGPAICKAAQGVGGKVPVVFALNTRPVAVGVAASFLPCPLLAQSGHP
jgi:hypothetical protein